MANTEYDDYPDEVKKLSIARLSEYLSDFKSISPETVAFMYRYILNLIHEYFKHSPERSEYNV
ncbi:MAG: hypothetical protein EOP06_27785 [Proteobacteria bacterium]|nr:MAG: hypothetical protein EOP06_27785 [Pseudomonadota bacterium]